MKPATVHFAPKTPAGKPRDKPYIVTRRGRVIGRFRTQAEASRLASTFPSKAASRSRHAPSNPKDARAAARRARLAARG